MASVNITPFVEAKFWQLLEQQRLNDRSQFVREGFFDEVPLYSRYSQLKFLEERFLGYSRKEIDSVMIKFGLHYLEIILDKCVPKENFLAALTVRNSSGKNFRLLPSIFVCHGRVEELLDGRLELVPPKSVFAKRLETIVSDIAGPNRYHVLQDSLTVPRDVRVFVGPRHLSNSLMVGVDAFMRINEPRNARTTRLRSASTRNRGKPELPSA